MEVIICIIHSILGYVYTYTEMVGSCEFSTPDIDYDYEEHYDYDYAEEDEEECLQSCLRKSRMINNAVGCYFYKTYGRCVLIKSGTIVTSSGLSDGTCWTFHSGKNYTRKGRNANMDFTLLWVISTTVVFSH